MRDRSIDVGRGLLVLIMVYCHVLQFFGNTEVFPVIATIIDIVNVTVFPTFVFYFGATAVLAYLDKPYRRALPGMARTFARSLAAFWLSGIGFRVLRERRAFAPGTVRRVMQLADIPGWSEFLISFALYSLLLIALFSALRALSYRPLAALGVGALCLCCTWIPYSKVTIPQIALLIGGRDQSYFPVVQYMPYFLAGMIYARGDRRVRLKMLALAAVCSAAGLAYTLISGGLPSRFPPKWAWILLSAMSTASVVLLSKGLCTLTGEGVRRAMNALCSVLSHFGTRSLYYLMCSNLVIFTVAGMGSAPAVARKSILPWTLPIQSPQGALCWTAVLLAALWFVTILAGRGAKRTR